MYTDVRLDLYSPTGIHTVLIETHIHSLETHQILQCLKAQLSCDP